MGSYSNDMKYSKTHEWAKVVEDGVVKVGITNHAQEELRDVVFVELPKLGTAVQQGQPCAVIESVKAAFDFYGPVSGTVKDVNTAVEDDPAVVNKDSHGEGWFMTITMSDAKELDNLLDATAYEAFLKG